MGTLQVGPRCVLTCQPVIYGTSYGLRAGFTIGISEDCLLCIQYEGGNEGEGCC